MEGSEKTFFGFREVEAAEKQRLVRGVFSSVASSYDIMNDIMSLGLHRLWKQEFVSAIVPRPNRDYLDVAGGTGDIARLIAEKSGSRARIVLADINYAMLQAGRDKAINRGEPSSAELICADAEKLPLHDKSFDCYSIAFGIRNITDIPAALKEAYRVLKPGGRFMCLEFSPEVNPLLRGLYNAYSFKVIPKIGAAVAGDEESYRYLAESIKKFPAPDAFAAMISHAGFERVKHYALTGGVARIHSGWRI